MLLLDGAPTVADVAVEGMPVVRGVELTAVGPEMEVDEDDIEVESIGVCWIKGIVVCAPAVLEPIDDTDKEGTIP